VGPRADLRWVWKISLPPAFDPRTVQPVASRYTDPAIPVPLTGANCVNFGWYVSCRQDSVSLMYFYLFQTLLSAFYYLTLLRHA
jgi:hypothetical protein